jgi:hypothetical protein
MNCLAVSNWVFVIVGIARSSVAGAEGGRPGVVSIGLRDLDADTQASARPMISLYAVEEVEAFEEVTTCPLRPCCLPTQ